MATFELHHLSLSPRDQTGLFVENLDKPGWLRRAFGETRVFEHRGNLFHWVPYDTRKSDGPIVGVVERQLPLQHYEPPEDGGQPTSTEVWQGAVVTIDPEHHRDGQKLAFEKGTRIGQPLAVLSSLIGLLNQLPESPYIITVRAIWDEESFQAFAVAHGNVLRTVTFDFVVPNMFDLSGKLDEKLKKVGEDTGAQHIKITLESPDGVKADSTEVQAGVAYGAKGQATVTAKAMDGDTYSSTNKVRTSKVTRLMGQGKALISAMSDVIDEVLGRTNAGADRPDRDSDGTDRD